MSKKHIAAQYAISTIGCLFILISTSFAQPAKKAASTTNQPAKKTTAVAPAKPTKFTVKATLSSDMDCLVTINGVGKAITLKASKPAPVTLNSGESVIEAVSVDKKSTFKTKVNPTPGEKPVISISFFADIQFLDYVKQGNAAMVEASLKKNPSLASNEGETLASNPLEVAIENSQIDMVKLLINKGAHFASPSTIFPLHKAVLYASSTKAGKDKPAPDRELVDYFISKGCKVTDKDDGGNTPLHCAARAGKLDLLIYLIDLGADVNAKNDFNDTPLKIAQDKGFISIINYLKTKGGLDQ